MCGQRILVESGRSFGIRFMQEFPHRLINVEAMLIDGQTCASHVGCKMQDDCKDDY
jgi:hypothetical protein